MWLLRDSRKHIWFSITMVVKTVLKYVEFSSEEHISRFRGNAIY